MTVSLGRWTMDEGRGKKKKIRRSEDEKVRRLEGGCFAVGGWRYGVGGERERKEQEGGKVRR